MNELPFYGNTASEFGLGLDFYMTPCSGCDTGGASAGDTATTTTDTTSDISTTTTSSASAATTASSSTVVAASASSKLLVTGPDQIQFIHVVAVEPHANRNASYNDLLQYGGGARLARSVSAYDARRNEAWMQVVYEVKDGEFSTFLKRYDIAQATLLDVVPDIAVSSVLEHDINNGDLISIGFCANTTRRCLFKTSVNNSSNNFWRQKPLDNGDGSGHHHESIIAESVAATTDGTDFVPKQREIGRLPADVGDIMAGVSSYNAEEKILYIVAQLQQHARAADTSHKKSINDSGSNITSENDPISGSTKRQGGSGGRGGSSSSSSSSRNFGDANLHGRTAMNQKSASALLVCTKQGVCSRHGDATSSTTIGSDWHVLSIKVDTVAVSASKPLQWTNHHRAHSGSRLMICMA